MVPMNSFLTNKTLYMTTVPTLKCAQSIVANENIIRVVFFDEHNSSGLVDYLECAGLEVTTYRRGCINP